MNKIATILLAAGLSSSLIGVAQAEQQLDRQLTVQQTTIVNIKPPASALRVKVNMDHKNAIYRPGEIARIFVKPNQTSWVTVVNVDAEGNSTVIYPNRYETNNKVGANQVIEVCASEACNIAVSEPYGQNVLKVIASSSSKPIFGPNGLKRSGVFSEVDGGAVAFARNLSVMAAVPVQQTRYATDTQIFSVVPNYQASSQAKPTTTGQQVVSQTTVTDSSGGSVVTTVTNIGGAIGTTASGQITAQSSVGVDSLLASMKSDFGLQLIADSNNYRQGQNLRFTATAEKACELNVFSVNANGTYSVLIEKEPLKAGKSKFFPAADSQSQITVSGQPGKQRLLALCNASGGFFSGLFGRSVTMHQEGQATVDQLLQASESNNKATARAAASFNLSH